MFLMGTMVGLIIAVTAYMTAYDDGKWIPLAFACIFLLVCGTAMFGTDMAVVTFLVAMFACLIVAAVDKNVRATMILFAVIALVLAVAAGLDSGWIYTDRATRLYKEYFG